MGAFETVPFPGVQDLVKEINDGRVFLVPYDCDKNFEPMKRNGEGAHWAAIVGYFLHEKSMTEEAGENSTKIKFEPKASELESISEEELYLIAYQGKSK